MDDYGLCEECNQENTGWNKWCKACNAKHFQQNFEKWSSGNVDIDKFIQHTQLSANNQYIVLEWIPYYILNILQKAGLAKSIEQFGLIVKYIIGIIKIKIGNYGSLICL